MTPGRRSAAYGNGTPNIMRRCSLILKLFDQIRELKLVHELENVLALNGDLHTKLGGDALKLLLDDVEVCLLGVQRGQHGHREHVTEDSLADVVDVGTAFGQRNRNSCNDTATILAKNADNALDVRILSPARPTRSFQYASIVPDCRAPCISRCCFT